MVAASKSVKAQETHEGSVELADSRRPGAWTKIRSSHLKYIDNNELPYSHSYMYVLCPVN